MLVLSVVVVTIRVWKLRHTPVTRGAFYDMNIDLEQR
jgi:hypothetical protein